MNKYNTNIMKHELDNYEWGVIPIRSYKDFLDEVAKQESSQEGIIDAEFRTIDNPKDSAS